MYGLYAVIINKVQEVSENSIIQSTCFVDWITSFVLWCISDPSVIKQIMSSLRTVDLISVLIAIYAAAQHTVFRVYCVHILCSARIFFSYNFFLLMQNWGIPLMHLSLHMYSVFADVTTWVSLCGTSKVSFYFKLYAIFFSLFWRLFIWPKFQALP